MAGLAGNPVDGKHQPLCVLVEWGVDVVYLMAHLSGLGGGFAKAEDFAAGVFD